MEIISRTAEAEWESKLPQNAANWDESEIQLKKRRLQAQFECRFSGSLLRPDHCGCYNFDDPPFTSFRQLQLALELKSVWQIVCDIMIMLMTLVMSCNCCAWSVPRFSSSRAPSLDWLHLSGQWDLCSKEWAKWTLWLFGFVRPDLVDRLRFSSLCRFVQSFHGYALRTQRQPATNCPRPIITVQLSQKSTQQVGSNPFSSLTASLHMRPCRGLCFFWSNSLECQQISLTAIW